MSGSARGTVPYVVVLAIAAFLFYRTTQLGFDAPNGRIGPDVWPKIVLGLLALVCAYEILKRILFGARKSEIGGVLESVVEGMPDAADDDNTPVTRTYRWLLVSGVLLTIAYVALLGVFGFFLCTFLYLAGFILLGGYRRLTVLLATSLLGSLAFMFVFMKVVYVSLPLGVYPFAEVSLFLMRVMGIR